MPVIVDIPKHTKNSIHESHTILWIIHWSRYPTDIEKSFSESTWKVPLSPAPKEPITQTTVFSPHVKVQGSSCSWLKNYLLNGAGSWRFWAVFLFWSSSWKGWGGDIMEGRLLAFPEGSSPAALEMPWGTLGGTCSSHRYPLPSLLSPSSSLAGKKASSNKRAHISTCFAC